MRAGAAAGLAALAALAACRPAPARTARAAPDPLWARAELVVGSGAGHLPLPARALAAIGGGRAVAIVDGGGVAVIELARGEVARAAAAVIDGDVTGAAPLRDGRVVAVGTARGRARAWWIDPEALTARGADLPGGGAPIGALEVAASSHRDALAVTAVDLPLALRDPATLAVTRVLSPERNWQHPVFVEDLYLAAWHHGALYAFDLATGREEYRAETASAFVSPDGAAIVHLPGRVHLDLVDLHDPERAVPLAAEDPLAVAWSPDGQHAVLVDPDRVVAVAVPSGDSAAIATPGGASRAVFAADASQLVVTAAGALWRVDPVDGELTPPPGPSAGAVWFVAPTPDGGVIAAADRWRAFDRGGRVRASGAWRGAAGAGQLAGDGAIDWGALGAAFAASPDGGRVAAASQMGGEAFVEAWDARGGGELVSAIAEDDVVAVDVDDAGAITAGSADAIARLEPGGGGAALAAPRFAPARALAAAADRAAYARAGAIAVTDRAAGGAIATAVAFDCDDGAGLRLARDGARLAVWVGDRVAVWDVRGGAGAAPASRDGEPDPAAAAAAAAPAVTAATARLIGAARLPAAVRTLALVGDRVVIAAGDRVVLWDPARGRGAAALALHAAVTAIGADPDGARVALGTGDGRAGVWRAAALDGAATPLQLGDPGALPTACPGDPLAAAGDDADERARRGLLHALPR